MGGHRLVGRSSDGGEDQLLASSTVPSRPVAGMPDVLSTKVGRLVAEHFADPTRLASFGKTRFIRFAATRGLIVQRRSPHGGSGSS